MADPINVLAFLGSLRAGSFNRMALNAAIAAKPADMTITVARIDDLPLYNDDMRQAGYPAPVQRVREQVRAADAILFVSPEYNYSVPGVLKNAIDWVSRPPQQPFDGKPCAMMGASTSLLGTARMQYHLRQMCVFLNMQPLNRPEVMIAGAAAKFADDGSLADAKTGEFIAQLLVALDAWTRRLKASA